MATQAVSAQIGAVVAPVMDVDRLLQRLPAEPRAQLHWAKAHIDALVNEVVADSDDPDLLDRASQDAMRPLLAVGAAAYRWLASVDPDGYRASMMSDLERDRDRLANFLADDDSVDTLQWCFGLLQSLYSIAIGSDSWSLDAPEELDPARIELAAEEPALRHFRRGGFALMAAAECAKRTVDAARAAALVDIAFLELEAFQQQLNREGIPISPFPTETAEHRRERMRAYAQRIRETFNDSDLAVLDSAHLTDLDE